MGQNGFQKAPECSTRGLVRLLQEARREEAEVRGATLVSSSAQRRDAKKLSGFQFSVFFVVVLCGVNRAG